MSRACVGSDVQEASDILGIIFFLSFFGYGDQQGYLDVEVFGSRANSVTVETERVNQ